MILPAIRRLARLMEIACLATGALGLLYMVFVVAFNVIARIIFDASGTAINLMIPGAIEQVSYVLGLVALAALAASMGQGMIAVDFLVERLPARPRALVARLWYLGIVGFALALCWLFFHDFQAAMARREVTQDLRLPMSLIYAVYMLECLCVAIVALREALSSDGRHAELS